MAVVARVAGGPQGARGALCGATGRLEGETGLISRGRNRDGCGGAGYHVGDPGDGMERQRAGTLRRADYGQYVKGLDKQIEDCRIQQFG